jgi:2,3-bisphosphoglycerate-dependent phosphoglycerate mutase
MSSLVVLRHGESEWNSRNLFTGWVDVDLTARGEAQARHSATLLREADLMPTVVHTSVLTRAVRTGAIVLDALDHPEVPTRRHWRLNERCYGALQGMERTAARERFGDDLYLQWRRSFDVPPPPLEPGTPGDPAADPRYADLPDGTLPRTESLADVTARLLPYWQRAILPDLRAGHTVLVVAHGNSLRALVAHLDQLSREEVLALNIPTGMPLHYDLGADLTPRVRGGRYLEPAAAADAAAAVAAEGH